MAFYLMRDSADRMRIIVGFTLKGKGMYLLTQGSRPWGMFFTLPQWFGIMLWRMGLRWP